MAKEIDIEWKKIDEFYSYYTDEDGETHQLPRFPTRNRSTDAGYDVYSAESGMVPPRSSKNFHTGIRLACPIGYFYSIRGRSGLGFKNVQPFIGTLDSGYNGELRILLINHSDEPHFVHKGDRIAQIIFEEQIDIGAATEVEEFSPEYDQRGQAGFGSSGK